MKINNYYRYIIGIILGVLFMIPMYSKWSYYNIGVLILLITAVIVDLKNGDNV